eukprot:7202343-Prymnesium_polylepis.2
MSRHVAGMSRRMSRACRGHVAPCRGCVVPCRGHVAGVSRHVARCRSCVGGRSTYVNTSTCLKGPTRLGGVGAAGLTGYDTLRREGGSREHRVWPGQPSPPLPGPQLGTSHVNTGSYGVGRGIIAGRHIVRLFDSEARGGY